MRTSTATKHKYQSLGYTVLRAIQEDNLIRLTVPAGSANLPGQIRRTRADMMIGGPSKTKDWVWVNA